MRVRDKIDSGRRTQITGRKINAGRIENRDYSEINRTTRSLEKIIIRTNDSKVDPSLISALYINAFDRRESFEPLKTIESRCHVDFDSVQGNLA